METAVMGGKPEVFEEKITIIIFLMTIQLKIKLIEYVEDDYKIF